jgi:ppGpp synthetase/RelA/SpoT-type nucleotidyltranferase
MLMEASDKRIANQLFASIEREFSRVGLLHRIFYRVKSLESLENKLSKDPEKYSEEGKKIQDLYGFRVTLYFPDDIKVAQNILSTLYKKIDETVDEAENTIFDATRCNFIYELPKEASEESSILCCEPRVDATFEVQYRTVLSEGWHEVEHDLRYKCKNDWKEHDDLGRALNGILATLETSDWGMSKLFEDLSYRHYKNSNWDAMIRTKFRLRLTGSLHEKLASQLIGNQLGKRLYRVSRDNLLIEISKSNLKMPMNLNNIVYLCNYLFLKSKEIANLTPTPLISMFEENFQILERA